MKTFLQISVCLFFCPTISAESFSPSNKSFELHPYGFSENKGQVRDQDGKLRSDILYLLEHDCFKMALGKHFFCYEMTSVQNEEVGDENELKAQKRNEGNEISQIEHCTVTTTRTDVLLTGANDDVQIKAYGQSIDFKNFYTGSLEVTNIYSYQRIVYENIYPHIDLVFYIQNVSDTRATQVKYDFIIHPEGDIHSIQLYYQGLTPLCVNANGELISTFMENNFVKESKPLSYYNEEEEMFFIPYHVNGETVSFQSKKLQHDKILTIDPVISWGRYVGGPSTEEIEEVKTDSDGNIYITGKSNSLQGIVTSGAWQTTKSSVFDCFITKLNSSGSLLWSTYYGGDGSDISYDIALGAPGYVYICGETKSTNVMGTPGTHQPSKSGDIDCFLAKFTTDGSRVWGTYFGGGLRDQAFSCIADQDDNIYMIGYTNSSANIATSDAQQVIFGAGGGDAFAAKFNSDGLVLFSTYFGGNFKDRAHDVTIDPFNNLIVIGTAASTTGMATAGTYQTINSGNSDAFLAAYTLAGALKWATFFGGPNIDRGRECMADDSGNIYFTGYTYSPSGIASDNAYQSVLNGIGPSSQDYSDGYLAKFDSTGNLIWSTYFGGAKDENSSSIKGLLNGLICIAGTSLSDDNLVTPDALQIARNGERDGFISFFSPSGKLVWSTYYGGTGDEVYQAGYGPNFDIYEETSLYFGISTHSAGLGTLNTYTPATSGKSTSDVLLTRIDLGCMDIYEPNNTQITAYKLTGIDPKINISALMNYTADTDFFSFDNTTPGAFYRIKLTNLAVDCNLTLRDSGFAQLSSSATNGTGDEKININSAYVGRYYLEISSPVAASSAECHNLSIQKFINPEKSSDVALNIFDETDKIEIFPNPSERWCHISLFSDKEKVTALQIRDLLGRIVKEQALSLLEGKNKVLADVSNLVSGTYLVSIKTDQAYVKKLVIF